MHEFVVYTGPNTNHDLETQQRIRSQAMRSFRRRERIDQLRSLDVHGNDPKRYPKGADIISSQSAGRTRNPPRTSSKEQHQSKDPLKVSNDDVVPDIFHKTHVSVHDIGDPSRGGNATFPAVRPPILHGDHMMDSASSHTLWAPATRSGSSSHDALSSAGMAQRCWAEWSADMTNNSQSSVMRYSQGPAASQSAQAYGSCRKCLGKAGRCDTRNPPESYGKTSIPSSPVAIVGQGYLTPRSLKNTPEHCLSSLSSLDESDRRALQYFQHVVAKDVAGIAAIDFWETLGLRMCQMEDTARRVAIALSQAHLEQTRIRSSTSHSHQVQSTLESEIKANRALRTYIQSTASPSHELVLTCSVMFYTLESLLGRETSAMLHLENGMRMFKAWQIRRKQSGSRGSETYRSLSAEFSRLDLTATVVKDDRMPVFEHDDNIYPSLDDKDLATRMNFTDSRDAHYQLMRLVTPTSAFLVQNHQWHGQYAYSIPHEILEEQNMHRIRYHAWAVAMDRHEYNQARYAGTDTRSWEARRAELMSLLYTRMTHWSAECMLEEFVRDEQGACGWDRTADKLLQYSKATIGYLEETRLEEGYLGHTSFSPEVGTTSILLMLAHRTTLPHIRTKALELAQRFNQKEGARDLYGAFVSWTRLPQPRPPFPFLLGQPGH